MYLTELNLNKKAWTRILNKNLEQEFWTSFDSIYLNSMFLVHIKFQRVYNHSRLIWNVDKSTSLNKNPEQESWTRIGKKSRTRILNKYSEQKFWTRILNMNPEQEFWTRILNKNSEQESWTRILNKNPEQDCWTRFLNKNSQLEFWTRFDSIYFNSQFFVQIKFQRVYNHSNRIDNVSFYYTNIVPN